MTLTPPQLSPFVLTVEERRPERIGDLDVYHPDRGRNRDHRSPAILFVHGGPVSGASGPDAVSPRDWPVYRGYAAAAAERGVVGAVVAHRLAVGLDRLPDAADDVEAAVSVLRSTERVDPDRIALWFFSGSGLLAGEWLDSRPEWLRCVALSYPLLAAPPGAPGTVAAAEVIGRVRDLPVTLVRAGLERAEVADAVEGFVAAARAAGAPLEVIDVPSGRHGFDMLDHTGESRDAVERALNRTVEHLTGSDSGRDTRSDTGAGPAIGADPDTSTAGTATVARPRRPARVRRSGTSQPAADVRPPEPTAPPAPPAPPLPVTAATEVVDRHLAAFAAGDLNAFLDTFAPNGQLHPRAGTPITGRRGLRQHYAAQFDGDPGKVEVLARIAEGDWVIDHQAVHGPEPEPVRQVVVRRVQEGSIVEVHHLP